MTFTEDLNLKTMQVNELLETCLPDESGNAKILYEAVNYSVRAGGKRIRPILVLEVFHLFCPYPTKEQEKVLHAFACAIEMIHTYSLVHDDLPAMDDDLLRRGKPTTHAAYGEAVGILAGDALLNYSFELISSAISHAASELSDSQKSLIFLQSSLKAMYVFSKNAGMYGMIKGQIIDMEYSGCLPESHDRSKGLSDGYETTQKRFDLPVLLEMYENKTSALLEASMLAGAILGGASQAELEITEKMAKKLGLAFQICDDILDIIGDESKIGKPVHSDEKNQKCTYVALTSINDAKKMAEVLTRDCLELLEKLPGNKMFLKNLFDFLLRREY